MSGRLQDQIRARLRAAPDGLTASEIAAQLPVYPSAVRTALTRMPDVYIDRWLVRHHIRPTAVWVAVAVPENCPMPGRAS